MNVNIIDVLINQIKNEGYNPNLIKINPLDTFKFIPYKVGKYRKLNINKILKQRRYEDRFRN